MCAVSIICTNQFGFLVSKQKFRNTLMAISLPDFFKLLPKRNKIARKETKETWSYFLLKLAFYFFSLPCSNSDIYSKYTNFIVVATSKIYLRTCAPSEITDQPEHSRSLIRILTERILDIKGFKVSSCGQVCRLLRVGCYASSLSAHIRKHVFFTLRFVYWER